MSDTTDAEAQAAAQEAAKAAAEAAAQQAKAEAIAADYQTLKRSKTWFLEAEDR